jgi:predicted amidohydrolase YtcJ
MGEREGRPTLVLARRIRTGAGEVEALLLLGGRVADAGAAEDLRRRWPAAGTLDLPELTVTPGLTDAHVHLVEWALARRWPELGTAASPAAAAAAVARSLEGGPAPRDGWVRGRGWDPHRWSQPAHRRHLDDALGELPVALQSHDMHAYWASSEALRRAGIDPTTADPEGGRIERGPDGEPTGVLYDNAVPLLLDAVPPATSSERRAALADGQRELHRLGVTGVHTVEPDSLGLLDEARAADVLRLRVLQHLPLARLEDAVRLGIRSGFGGPWLRIGGVKMFLDGALGSRTAWLHEPYEGTGDRGLSTLEPAVFRDAVRRGTRAGLAMAVHAIGDAATDLAMEVLTAHPVEGPIPHRIEHAQLMTSGRLEPGGNAGPGGAGVASQVVLSIQPSHLMTDWRAADRHWGERARRAFAFHSMEAAGFTLALGSDAPVEPPDPRHGLYAATARRDLDGEPEGGWYPGERLSMERAWAGYTTGPARAAGDGRQGRLIPGAFADLVAWDRDPAAADPEEVPSLQPILTMVNGEVVWSA